MGRIKVTLLEEDVARDAREFAGFPRKVRCHLCGHKFIAWTVEDASRLQHGTGCTDCARDKMRRAADWDRRPLRR